MASLGKPEDYALAPWMRLAESYIGQREIRGSRDNPVIVEFFAKAGHPEIKDDETAWCSAFANAIMYENGKQGTKSLMAKSWLKWEYGTTEVNPRFGDITIFDRPPDPASGHVAFFVKWDSNYVWVLGGNQSDSVSVVKMPRSRLRGFRRPRVGGAPKVPEMSQTEPKKSPIPGILGSGGVGTAIASQFGEWAAVIFVLTFGAFVTYMLLKDKK